MSFWYKVVFFLLCSLLGMNSFSQDLDQRRKQIINIINEELQEVRRLSAQRGHNNPDLFLRMAELNLEKARLYREKENNDYLSLTPKKRKRINKKSFFSQSSKYFQEANQLCLKITRRFRNYSKMGDVYYILGFNAKEANQERKAAKYLSLATRTSRDKQTKVKTQISLAEIYYNNKKYKKAIPLYESALSSHQDKWWTKDSFNLAWCYFRSNQYSKAIAKMKEIFNKSSSSKFIDMRAQVERDIGLFYATANRVDEGVQFYKKIGINFTDQLLRIAVSLITQGKYALASTVLEQAGKHEKNKKKLVEINLEKLNLYQLFGKISKHHLTSKLLYLSYNDRLLSSNQVKTYVFQMEKVAAILQRQVVSKTYKRLKKQQRAKAELAISYFEMLSNIEQKRADEFKFLKAETAYATRLYSRSLQYYKETLKVSEQLKRNKFIEKSIDGMLVILSHLKNSYKENIFVFEAYLKYFPKGKKSEAIYERLFNNYMSVKNYAKAKDVLDRFVKYYPNDIKQEAMIAKLMDAARARRDNDEIRAWIGLIDAGKYRVSTKYKNKLQELLTTMQIEDVQKELSVGNKKIALVGYLDILKDKYSTKKSKINAKYNLSALYYELGDTENSYRWSIAAMDEMAANDVLKFSSSFITIANFLFASLEYEKSANLSSLLVRKLCSKSTRKKYTAFKNSAFIYLADKKMDQAEKVLAIGKKCKIPLKIREEVEYEIMREYFYERNWSKYEFYAQKVRYSKYYYAEVIDDFLNLANIHQRFNNRDKVMAFVKIANGLYLKARKKNQSVSLRALDFFSQEHVRQMEEIYGQLKLMKFSSIDIFKKDFDRKFALLQRLEKKAEQVIKIGSGKGIVNAYKILHEAYESFANNLKTVVPSGLKKQHVEAFRKDLSAPIQAATTAARTYWQEAISAIENNSILNQNNFYFQGNKFPVKFFGVDESVFMDRGGK
ncbi:MAG: hypothetical protein CME66_02665 [Halobacteriovoraceae bacterium]|nr:hypothetical protein [Halobacteriovoraceae bacterium]